MGADNRARIMSAPCLTGECSIRHEVQWCLNCKARLELLAAQSPPPPVATDPRVALEESQRELADLKRWFAAVLLAVGPVWVTERHIEMAQTATLERVDTPHQKTVTWKAKSEEQSS